MLGPRRSPAEVGELHAGHPDIVWASERAYAQIPNTLPDREMYMQEACGEVSEHMVALLAMKGYSAHLYYSEGHIYPIMRSSRGVIVADPTWCQFFDEDAHVTGRVQEMPKVLVGTRPEVVAFGKEAGLDHGILNIWRTRPQALRGHVIRPNDYLFREKTQIHQRDIS